MSILNQIRSYLTRGSERSVLAKKNIVGSFINKGLAIVISLLLVPITIDYLDAEQYGVWLAISSMIAWISYFDLGLGHGFKNRFAEAKAHNDIKLAAQYVSTAYVALGMIFGGVLIVAEIINPYIHWDSILKIGIFYRYLLVQVCAALFLFVSINLVLGVLTNMLYADQRPAFASTITTTGQGIALIVIYIMTLLPHRSMLYICIALSGIPCMVLFIASIVLFKGRYKAFAPSFRNVNFKLFRNIIGLGGKFFIIQLCLLLIFQVVNIILSRQLGPESVTIYNVSYKYFSIIQMVFTIILTPFWAAYTDAYTQGDYAWMKNAYGKLIRMFYKLVLISLFMLIVSPVVFRIWLPSSVCISWPVSISMCLYTLCLTYSNLFMILINGIGKVTIQMIVYICFAVISIPACYYLCGEFGIPGILLVLSATYLVQSLFAQVQLKKLLNQTATGLWNK